MTCGEEGYGAICRVTARVRSSDRSGTLRYRCPHGHTLPSKTALENHVISETMRVLNTNSLTRPHEDPTASPAARDARAEITRLADKLSALAEDY